jgi:hypothetical protein
VIFHPTLWYAGTLDRIGRFPDSNTVLLDIKTSAKIEDVTGMQLAAYAGCLTTIPKMKLCVQLTKDGRYNVKEFSEYHWWRRFRACLDFWNLKKEMGYEI